ncbi:MAG: hypothetical protein QM820_20200 [Minicystis sp.]
MLVRHGVLAAVMAVWSVALGAGCGGGSSSGTDDAPVVLPPTNAGTSCQQSGGTCDDQAAVEAYSTCIVQTCSAEYAQCFGPDYMSGTFGGACGDYLSCAAACQNCDQACIDACTDQHFTGACKECITGPIATCAVSAISSGTCKLPCAPDLPIGGSGGCDDFKACCDSLSGAQATSCTMTYESVKLGGDLACGVAFSSYKTSGMCK